MDRKAEQSNAPKLVMGLSVGISVLMLGGKLTAYFLTHSFAVLSDAAESVVHGAATCLAAFSLWYASQPADVEHPYGHGRIAYFSAGFEGALVLAASIAVITSGVRGLIVGPELANLGWGLGISAALAAVNLALGTALIIVGRANDSIILISNGKHVLTDVWTTLAAILGLGLVMLTGVQWLDPLAALLIGVLIMVSGVGLLRKSYSGLMDKFEPEMSARLVQRLEETKRDGVITDFHQLRGRKTNDEIWIDLHVLVPGDMPTVEAHERVTRVESALRDLFTESKIWITAHIEPDVEHDAAHPSDFEHGADPLSSWPGRPAG